MPNPIGVCSWSLTPDSPAALAASLQSLRLRRVQLALDPIRTGHWSLDDTRTALENADIATTSAMITAHAEDYTTLDSIRATGGLRPDQHWSANLAAAEHSAAIAAQLHIPLVTLHAGFIPESPDDPLRQRMIQRIAAVADAFAKHDIRLALETGQESPNALLHVLNDPRLARVAVNFDPANMLLYDSGDPIHALTALAPRIAQIHLKDARPPTTPGTWGTETPLGEGAVDWPAFFSILAATLPDVPLMIERESGNDRTADIRRAADLAIRHGALP